MKVGERQNKLRILLPHGERITPQEILVLILQHPCLDDGGGVNIREEVSVSVEVSAREHFYLISWIEKAFKNSKKMQKKGREIVYTLESGFHCIECDVLTV